MIVFKEKSETSDTACIVEIMANAMRDLDQHGITVNETELRRRGFTKEQIEAYGIDAAARADAMDVRHVA